MAIGYRLNASELELLAKGATNPVITNFQILEILYQNRTRWVQTKEIEEKLNNLPYKNDITRRRVQEKLLHLCACKSGEATDPNVSSIVKRKKDPESAGWLYKLGDLFNTGSVKYKKEQLQIFSEWKAIIEMYDYIPFISDINKLLKELGGFDEVKQTYNIVELPNIEYIGKEFINAFFEAITEETKIDFTYKKFNEKEKEIKDFMPYLLKEHDKRWYVVGKKVVGGNFITYALDRVSSCRYDSSKDSFEREEFNSKKLFANSMGIYTSWQNSDLEHDSTAKNETNPINISFKVKDGDKFKNISYLLTNKIHSSQDESERDEEGWVTIKLKMFPETDLVRRIRGIGLHCVKDIEPKWFEKWVKGL